MRDASHQRITLFDMMVLIAATAVGFALARAEMTYFRWGARGGSAMPHVWLTDCVRVASCVPMTLMFALFTLRFRGPRPAFRNIAQQPGMAACCAAIMSVAFGVLLAIPRAAASARSGEELSIETFAIIVVNILGLGYSVAAAWLTLLLAVGWRPERSWQDRLGRALGAYWIAALIVVAWGYILA